MSRICIKNLPKYVAEDRLREMFSQKGEVTDAKLMRTKDGKSRQFAFIGYRTEHEAEEAIKYFNRSYLDTCRITCEIAYKVGDPHAPRPWSRYSLTKEGKLSEDEKKVTDAKYEGLADLVEDAKKLIKSSRDNDDPQLQEFLQVMQPRIRSKLWADDTLGASVISLTGNTSDNLAQENNKASEKLDTGEAELKEMKKSECKISDNHLRGKSQHLAHDEGLSDMDYFKSRVKEQWADSDSTEDHIDSDNDKECHKQDIQEHDSLREYGLQEEDEEAPLSSSKDAKEEVLKTGRVFVRNLPYTATEDELEELFRKFGDVSNVHLVVDKVTKRSKGIAYVLFTLPECALRALEHLDNSSFQGRLLHVMPAKQSNSPDKQKPDVSPNQSSKTFKKQREEERKAAEVIGDTKAWNSLFMRSDTVAENIARKYGVSKSNLLDRDVDDLAVHLALGETQVLLETKMALANAGVNVASLEEHSSGKSDGIKRSNQVLLVKNLPFGSSEAELARMFGKYGSLDKIIIPATKILALVVFLEPVEARAAFRGLAYKRYKDAPLYLEWAPGNIFDKDPTFTSNGDIKTVVGEHCAKGALLKHDSGEIHDMENDPDRVESRTLFIKNLNFKTTDENLKGHFGEHTKNGRILSAKVKKHLKDGKSVSMGFGFIEFDSVETATNVCRDLQGTVLDGHALILQLCHTKEDENVLGKVDKDKSSTKLIVRNVAFEATKKDLRQLFTPFGQIKSLRLPMKFGNHRGFAFVEFITKQEAQNALKSLSNTHLYGRHLVLERAKEGETLEELRARTAVQFAGEQNGGSGGHLLRLSKKRKQIALLDEGNAKFGRIAS